MKYCKVCNKIKEDNEFYIRKRNGQPYGDCISCKRLDTIKRLKSYKVKSVEYLGNRCTLCGYDKCIDALEFHHTNPSTKDPDYRAMRNWSFESKKKELNKCILVCSNCHREIHAGLHPFVEFMRINEFSIEE